MKSAPAAVPSRPCALAAAAFADHLAARHEQLSQAWRTAVDSARWPDVPEARSPARFRLQVPQVLLELERGLRGEASAAAAASASGGLADPAALGADGWPSGYDLREFVFDLGQLHRCLLLELGATRDGLPLADPDALLELEDELARLIHLMAAEGAGRYDLMQQQEATRRRGDLEDALANLAEQTRKRSTTLRASAHDLRGQLAIIMSATDFIDDPTVNEAMRAKSSGILKRGVRNLKEMLVSLIDETQPDAEDEMRHLSAFDAGTLLGALCATSDSLARERNLSLQWEGPEMLLVEGDRNKVQRIAQNLLLNALSFTGRGGVTLSWWDDSPATWSFQVRDTGPGLPAGCREWLEGRPVESPGEGTGLRIVQRLCEALDARLKTDIPPDGGTSFTVTLPRRYAA